VAAGAQVEWVTGFPRGTYTAGLFCVLLAAYVAGIAPAAGLGGWPLSPLNPAAVLVVIGAMVIFAVPASIAYAVLMPTQASLGLLPDGVIVEMSSPLKTVRQGYRWGDVRLRGRSLVLSRARPWTPRALRLTAAQFARIAPRIGPG
jgi:hypothetical protein